MDNVEFAGKKGLGTTVEHGVVADSTEDRNGAGTLEGGVVRRLEVSGSVVDVEAAAVDVLVPLVLMGVEVVEFEVVKLETIRVEVVEELVVVLAATELVVIGTAG